MEIFHNPSALSSNVIGSNNIHGAKRSNNELPRFCISPHGTKPPSEKVFSDAAFLYVATGNDTADYAEHYGNDACVLHRLYGARSLLFARSTRDALRYQDAGTRALERLNELNKIHYGLQLPASLNQFVSVIWSGEVTPSASGLAKATAETLALAKENGGSLHELTRALTNASFNQLTAIQLSHVEALLASQDLTSAQSPSSGAIRIADTLSETAAQALQLNNKSVYYAITREATVDLPRHVPTTVVTAERVYELINDPQRLSKLQSELGITDGAVIVKSALEAGGECCVVLRRDSDTIPLLSLISSLREKGRQLSETPCLVQKLIEPCEHYLPARIGIIGSVGTEQPFEVSTQLYSDSERKTYLGSLWTEGMSDQCVLNIGAVRIRHLLNEFSLRGYRGPLGLDAMLDQEGNYTMIYDANPRLTSVAAVLMVRDALRNMGVSVTAAASLGHHGNWEIPSIDVTLRSLEEENLLFTKTSRSGAFIIPNWRGENRFDVYAINMTPERTVDLFEQLCQSSSAAPAGLHF